ncbi:hypothetical protein HAV15_001508 [Penicillium sp. str. |nr:hypothetical protein HAV15_001508 [Penicillium sp. str. \
MDTHMDHTEIPVIETDEPLFDVLPKLFNFISMAVGDMAYTFEQMLYGSQGHRLRQLVHALADDTHNPFIIVALMILKWDFTTATEDDWGLNESRGAACEFVAWQFLCHLNQGETIEFLLEELPTPRRGSTNIIEPEAGSTGLASIQGDTSQTESEATPLLPNSSFYRLFGKRTTETQLSGTSQDTQTHAEIYAAQRYSQFFGLNALEIATIAHAKRFLSQRVVQKVVDGIWKGEIVFWDSLTVNSTKKPHIFNRRTSDPYSRLRVPLYRKIFEAAFFMSFLFLYYAVLVERRQDAVGIFEAVMYVWIVAFAYDELSGILDAGVIRVNGATNEDATGVIGLAKGNDPIIELSFDILSLEALFLVPRICSLVSLNSYFGSLIPVLKEMTKAFFRFFPVVVVLYVGFLTTFTMLARDRLSLSTMSHLLVKVFFGSSVLGLDTASEISPIFGYGLMLTFALMTNTLILSSLISLMSMSLEGVMRHAREEYLFQILFPSSVSAPCGFLSAGTVRRVRIVLLRATHLPFVALIWAYESKWRDSKRQNSLLPPMSARQGISENPTGPRCQDPHHPSVVETNRLGPGKAPSVDQQAARELDMGQFGGKYRSLRT